MILNFLRPRGQMIKYLLTELGQVRTGKYLALRHYTQTRWSRCTRPVSHDLGSNISSVRTSHSVNEQIYHDEVSQNVFNCL